MINFLATPAKDGSDLRNFEEETIDLDVYQVESGLSDLFEDLTYLRNNDPEQFQDRLIDWKDIVSTLETMNSRIRLMEEYVKIEEDYE